MALLIVVVAVVVVVVVVGGGGGGGTLCRCCVRKNRERPISAPQFRCNGMSLSLSLSGYRSPPSIELPTSDRFGYRRENNNGPASNRAGIIMR